MRLLFAVAKSSSFAIEALAGLASNEDFSSVMLKKPSSCNSSTLPFKDLMLIQVKGRRHVQVRLVAPTASSINQGDCYILITPSALYYYMGKYSNVVEQFRACDIVNHIQQTGDMGCKVEKIITLNSKKSNSSKDVQNFWKALGATEDVDVVPAGHPDEDEVFESNIIFTNMIYEVEDDELIPLEDFWGKIPKIEILQPAKVLVFDFGTEMYVWSGKTADFEQKRCGLRLARALWSEGYNYTECDVCPFSVAEILGARMRSDTIVKADERPDWAMFSKITQHRETILFREKFLDWPDYSKIIKVKIEDGDKIDSFIDIRPCNVEDFVNSKYIEPDFEVDGVHLGRGNQYYDEVSLRYYEIYTLSVTCWRILENMYEKVTEENVGHLYDADTYIFRWQFRVTNTGRELSGKPSKYNLTGRDRCLYFCWLGSEASVNEKGAAAVLTVELDSENARQVRVTQGSEPTVFLRLFDGKMIINTGKHGQTSGKKHKLYISRGEIEEESHLVQVPCSMRSLRSRGSFVYFNAESGKVIVWHGSKSLFQTRYVTERLAKHVAGCKGSFGLIHEDVEVQITEEGDETDEFLSALGGKRQLYISCKLSTQNFEYTPKLFYFSSVSGSFTIVEILCPYRSESVTPFPFLQADLYSATQPGN